MNSIEQGAFAVTSPFGGQLREVTGGGEEGVDFASALAERSADMPAVAEDACEQQSHRLPGRKHAATRPVANGSNDAARGRQSAKHAGGVENQDQPPAAEAAMSAAQGAVIAIAVLNRALGMPSSPTLPPQPATDGSSSQFAKPSRPRMGPYLGTSLTSPGDAWGTEGASDPQPHAGETQSSFKLSVAHQATFFFPARAADASGSAVAEPDIQSLQDTTHEWTNTTRSVVHAQSSPAADMTVRELPKPVVDLGTVFSLPQAIDDPVPSSLLAGGGSDSNDVSGTRIPQTAQWAASGAALRTLSLQLSPKHLGLVNIELTHADGGLKVSLNLEHPDAVDEIEGGRTEIVGRLSDAGYAVTDLIVRRSDGQSASSDSIGVRNDGAIDNGPSGSPDRNSSGEHHSRETPDHEAHGTAARAIPTSQSMLQPASEKTPWIRLAGLRNFTSV